MSLQPGTLNIKLGEGEQLIIKYEKVTKPNGETSTRRYVQSRLLGRGGFAKVYQFTCLETQEVYAAKVIPKASLKEEIYMQKFKAEIKLHKSLNHPNIVRFDRYFDDQENVYILLELCVHDSLSQLLIRRKKLTEIEAQCYVLQTVQALKHIHDQKILHRDLKLANLLLSDRMQLKVADFGLAAKLSSDAEKRKTVCGTPNFMAPEVLNNSKGYSYPADIWSLGVICFNLLTGKLPFEATTSKEIYRKVQEGKFTFPANMTLSPAAKDIITKMLVVDPEKRITLNQIISHPFLNPKGGIPQTMPSSTLTAPPNASILKQYATATASTTATNEAPKLSNLFHKVEVINENKELRYKSVEPTKTPARSPVKQKTQERTRESQTPTPMRKKALNKSESSIGNATCETKTSFNKDNANAYKTAPKQDRGLQGLKEILCEVKDVGNVDGNGNVQVNVAKMNELVNGDHAKKVSMANGRALVNFHNRTISDKKENSDNIENKPMQNQRGKVRYSMKKDDLRQASVDVRPGSAMGNKEVKEQKEEKEAVDKVDKVEKEEKINLLQAWPFVRVLHWLDYTTGYGLGYTLSDGSVGALFNDDTKIVLSPDGEKLDYINMEIGKKEVHMEYSMRQYPAPLKEKVMDLERFDKYFERHNQKATKETGQSQSNGLLYVKKWLKTKHAAFFRMSTHDLQVVFIDNSMMVMNPDGKKIKFVSKKGDIRNYNLETDSLSKDSEVKKRLTYTMEVLEKIWAKKNEDMAKKKGEKNDMDLKF